MKKIRLEYDLEDCSNCPLVKKEKSVGYGYAIDYHCSAADRKIMGGIERPSEYSSVPEQEYNRRPLQKEIETR